MEEKKTDWVDWLKTIVITVLVVVLFRAFIAVPIIVDGSSMLPTLEGGDRIIVNKFSQLYSEPDRFDVVIFHATAKKDYIKRVIGLPGETIVYQNDQLFVNGQAVKEPFIHNEIEQATSHYTTDFTLLDIENGAEVVPEGHVFVLGDNRPGSTDSRQLGFIPMDEIVGVASVSYWPLNKIGFVE
ncbi:signal peptidase I [Gracilibacillus sp. S3-1-1]|uniref:Signal peptidase I n=1 Tax=Gracilibacillus pellucidus TaxID=3095368 RepID=A0ACC6M7G0_9BACI|nr:signal peptidase I [Gracilibacillus sp. S3-1-1]MDX8046918.1 signal peptidase I [Gracilibacillus sp. S3-1-1]